MFHRYLRIFVVLFAMTLLGGCAENETVIETTTPVSMIEPGKGVNMYDRFDLIEYTNDGLYPKCKQLSSAQTVTFDEQEQPNGTRTYVLRFDVKAANRCVPLKITFVGTETVSETYYVPVQWTCIRIPVMTADLTSVTLEPQGELLLGYAGYERTTESIADISTQIGMHMIEQFTDVTVTHENSAVVGGKSIDIVKNGNIIYSIGDSKLTIIDVSDPVKPKELSELGDLGASIRQICMLSDKKHVFISSRENGCYIVNIEDPCTPKLVSTYDSVEMATGVDAYGDYVFVCDRQYGVEIVDISDVYNPKQCSIVRCGTAQSCHVANGILYAGCWNERSIEIFDVTQPSDPKFLGSTKLHGKGDGMTVMQIGDKTYLYAATGQHEAGVVESVDERNPEDRVLAQLKFGQGNGLDIYDVTDPTAPIWLSTSRIDGRYYFANNDYWEVEVSEADGRYYAYCLNTFNGVYILDVTDPAAPMRLAHVSVVSSAVDIQNYPGRASIFPYDQEERRQCPIAGIACDEGVLYMASPMTYTYIYDGVELQPWLHTVSEKVLNTPIEKDNGTFYDLNIETLGVSGLKHYKSTGQCYAVVAYNGLYYAACGAEGVVVLDQSLNKLSTIAIEGVAQDVQIYEGTLYCAEKMGGLGCYELSADGLSATEQWHYTTKRGVVRQVRLSPKGRWAILMVGPVYGEIISTETASYVLHCTASSQMYHHTLLNTLAGGRYTGIWAEGGKAFWYDFGADDEYNKPVLLDEWSGNVAAINNGSMTGGVPESDKFVLATRDIANGAGGGYAIYDITTGNAPPLVVKDANMPFSGKPLIFGNTLITGERINGRICFVDISMLSSPKVKSTVSVNGNPDIPIVDGNAVLVPLGYQGLIKFDLPK